MEKISRKSLKEAFGILLLLSLTGHLAIGQGQSPIPGEGTQIERVPNLTWNKVVNHPKQTLSLSDYEGKAVILDFWTLTCGPCIAAFPKLDSLQRKYGNDVKIVLVNATAGRDEPSKILALFEKTGKKISNKFSIPSVLNDSLGRALFPYLAVPHIVWIAKDRNLVAITDGEELTEAHVKELAAGATPEMVPKVDLVIDHQKPLFGPVSNLKAPPVFNSTLAKYRDGISNGRGIHQVEGGLVDRIFAINDNVLTLYTIAYPEISKYKPTRLILDFVHPQKYYMDNPDRQWRRENAYTYELTLPPASRQQALAMMRQDLQRYFGLEIRTEKRLTDAWIIKIQDAKRLPAPTDGPPQDNLKITDEAQKYIRNWRMDVFAYHFSDILKTHVLDETGYTKKISIQLPANFHDVAALQKALRQNGLVMEKQQRELEFLILSDKPAK